VLIWAMAIGGCSWLTPEPDYAPARRTSVVPQEFLLTSYEPLNAWLDTPVRVQIVDVPLSRVFQEPALSGLNHRLFRMPEDDPLISIDSLALTRRQLLWAIAHDHKLAMIPKFTGQGAESYIDIRGPREPEVLVQSIPGS